MVCVYIYIYYMSYCTKIVARWPRWSQRLEIWDRGKIRGRKGATRDIDWNTTSVGGRARIHRWCPLLLLGWHPQMWISKWRTAPTDVWLVNFSTGHVSGKWWYPMVHGLYYIWLYYDYILCIYIYPTHGYLMYVLFWWLLESRYEDKFHRLWRFDSANWLSQIPELKIKPCWLLKADTYTSHDVRSWKFLGGLAVEFPPRRFAVLGLTWHPNSWPATALGVGKNALGFSTSCSNGFWRLHLQCLNDTFHHPCFVIELLVSLVFPHPLRLLPLPTVRGTVDQACHTVDRDEPHGMMGPRCYVAEIHSNFLQTRRAMLGVAGMCPTCSGVIWGKPRRGNLEHSNLRGSFRVFL
jgi:hypothetical protein